MADKVITIELDLQSKRSGQGLKTAVRDVEAIKKSANEAREQFEKIAQVGGRLTMLGASITGPLVLGMKAYVDKYKESERVAQKAVQAQEKIARSWERVGRVLTNEALPALEKAADIASKIASWTERNPGLANAMLNVGLLLTTAGVVTTAVAQIAGTIVTLKGLLAGSAVAGAFTKGSMALSGVLANPATWAVGGTILAASVAAVAGAYIGKGIGNAANRALGQKEQTWGDIGTTAQRMGALSGAGGAFLLKSLGFDDASKDVWNLSKAIFGLSDSVKKATGEMGTAGAAGALDKVKSSVKSLSNAAFRQAEATEQIRVSSEKYLAAQKTVSTILAEIAQRERERAMERARIVADGERELERMAEDHNRNLKNIERRRQQDVMGAVQQRDALAVERANQAAAEEKQEAEESYRLERRRREEDLRLQLQYFDQASRLQREADLRRLDEAKRIAEYELQIIRQAEQMKLQIYMDSLNRIRQAGGLGGTGYIPQNNTGGGSNNIQNITVKMASGQTMQQTRRELNSQNRRLSYALEGI